MHSHTTLKIYLWRACEPVILPYKVINGRFTTLYGIIIQLLTTNYLCPRYSTIIDDVVVKLKETPRPCLPVIMSCVLHCPYTCLCTPVNLYSCRLSMYTIYCVNVYYVICKLCDVMFCYIVYNRDVPGYTNFRTLSLFICL